MKFEDIQRVNEGLKTTDIKGKDYVEVNQRIKAFRQLFPDGFIKTELVRLEDGMCVMKAKVGLNRIARTAGEGYYDIDAVVLGTGYAYEKEQSSFINKTSYIENCETSAVGRALGMLGIGIDTSVASYEEVANAMENQKKKETISAAEAKKLLKLIQDYPGNDTIEVRLNKIRSRYGIENLEDMNSEQYLQLVKQLEVKK